MEIANADHFLAGNRIALAAPAKCGGWEVLAVFFYGFARLVRMGVWLPVVLRIDAAVGEYFHNIATAQGGGDGFEPTVDAGIFCMVAEVGMHFVGKVYGSGVLRQDYLFAFGCEHLYVVIIEGRADVLHVAFVVHR